MIPKQVYLYSILFTDPQPILDAIAESLDSSKLANPYVLEFSDETRLAIINLILCKSTVEQVSSYLEDRLIKTLSTMSAVEGLVVDRVVI